jgi:hypothetical protein
MYLKITIIYLPITKTFKDVVYAAAVAVVGFEYG